MIADVSGFTSCWELGIFRQTNGSKYWHSKLNYPSFGVSIFQQINPNRDTLGITTSVLPNIRFVWWRNHRWEGFFGLGTGLAVVSKIFDAEKNPNNNLMGSHLNVHVQLKPGIRYRFHPNWSMSLSGVVNHVSNGLLKQPNLGTNYFGGNLALSYHFTKTAIQQAPEPSTLKKNGYWLRIGVGAKEKEVNYIPRLRPIYNIYGGYSRMTGHTNKLMAGLHIAYDQTVYEQLYVDYPDETSISKTKAANISVVVGDEIMVGQLGIMALLGCHLYYPESRPGWMFWRIGGNIYSKPIGKQSNMRYFFGVSLKANGTTADHFEVASGWTF